MRTRYVWRLGLNEDWIDMRTGFIWIYMRTRVIWGLKAGFYEDWGYMRTWLCEDLVMKTRLYEDWIYMRTRVIWGLGMGYTRTGVIWGVGQWGLYLLWLFSRAATTLSNRGINPNNPSNNSNNLSNSHNPRSPNNPSNPNNHSNRKPYRTEVLEGKFSESSPYIT